MSTHITLFRGINVGGKNSLPMKDLKAILESLGTTDVQTYIQSGNAVFKTTSKLPASFTSKLAAEIEKQHGFEPHIQILDLPTLRQAIENNPYPEAEANPTSLHVRFLASKPTKPYLEKLTALKKETERFHLTERIFYLHAPNGIGKSKLAANTERLLGVPLTDRNWRTVCKLLEMAET